jgi:hypothetical protein
MELENLLFYELWEEYICYSQPADSCLVLEREAFGDRTLNSIRVLMQTDWVTRSVAFAGYTVPLSGEFPVSEMNKSWQERYPQMS